MSTETDHIATADVEGSDTANTTGATSVPASSSVVSTNPVRPWWDPKSHFTFVYRSTHRKEQWVRADATFGVLQWVAKTRSWIPAWQRVLQNVIDATRPSNEDVSNGVEGLTQSTRGVVARPDPGNGDANPSQNPKLDHAVDQAKLIGTMHWSPERALTELAARDDRSVEGTKEVKGSEIYRAEVLIGDHLELFVANLEEANSNWPKDLDDAVPDATAALAAVNRALQHALYLGFLNDAADARIGEKRDIRAYCEGWNLDPGQKDGLALWLRHDPAEFGERPLPLVIDRPSASAYRKARTVWEKTYTNLAVLWGGALAFGVVAGVFWLLNQIDLATWPKVWGWKMTVLFLAVAGGALLHLASRSLYAINFDDPLEVYVSSDLVDWLSLRWLAILRIYIPIAFVVGSLWAAGTVPASFQDISTAVLAGFSADSVFRAAISRVQATPSSPPASSSAGTQSANS